MAIEENKQTVREAVEMVWNRNDWSVAHRYYAEDIVIHFAPFSEPVRGRDTFGRLHKLVGDGFPDRRVEIEELVAEGNYVAGRWTMRATHLGEFMGIPPTGERIEVEEFSLFRIGEDGKGAEGWLIPDLLGQLQQLGVMPPAAPPRPVRFLMGLLSRGGAPPPL